MVNVLLFTDNHFGDFFIRGAGTYRIATEIRKAGYTCQVVDFFGFMTYDDIQKIIDKYVGKETLVVGFGSTFITPSDEYCYLYNSDINTHVKSRRKKFEILSHESIVTVKYPFSNDVIKDLMEKCKTKNPNIKFVYGGAKAKNKASAGIDCFFTNDNGDMDIIDYLNKLKYNQPLPHSYDTTNKTDFDFNSSQIIWDESDFIFKNEVLPIEISRGCIFKCAFCSFNLNGKKKFDYIKEPSILREEFIHNYEAYGTTSYIFCDDTFNDSTYKLELLYNEVISKLPFKIQFSTYLRLDLLSAHEEQISLLKDMGICCAFFGIESINDQPLKIIGKNLSLDKIEKTLSLVRSKWGDDIFIIGSFIYGLPGETKESLELLEDWILNKSNKWLNQIQLSPLYVIMNETVDSNFRSEFSNNYKKYDLIKLDNTHNWYSQSLKMNFSDIKNHVYKLRELISSKNGYSNILHSIGIIGFNNVDINNINSINKIDQNVIDNNYVNKILNYKQRIING